MKITCECLVVKNPVTGELEPLVLDFPDCKKQDLVELRTRAYESGRRMKLGLISAGAIICPDCQGSGFDAFSLPCPNACPPKYKLNINTETLYDDMYAAGVKDRDLFNEQMEDCAQPSTVNSVLNTLKTWLDVDKEAGTVEGFNIASKQVAQTLKDVGVDETDPDHAALTRDPLDAFTDCMLGSFLGRGGKISKDDFKKIWDSTLGPALESGDVTWECSEELEKHLLKVANDEYTEDEIMALIDSGKL